MGEGKRELFPDIDHAKELGRSSANPRLGAQSPRGLFGPPRVVEMQLRKAVDPYNTNPLVFQYFPSEFTDKEETIWKDPTTTDTFGTVSHFERISPRVVTFALFLNDYGISQQTLAKSNRIMRTELSIAWLKQHMRPLFTRLSTEKEEPPLLELVPFPTIDAEGGLKYIFRCVIESINIRSTIVRSATPTLSAFEGAGRMPMKLGERIRATVDVTLRSHDRFKEVP